MTWFDSGPAMIHTFYWRPDSIPPGWLQSTYLREGMVRVIDIDWPVALPKLNYVAPIMQSGQTDLTHWETNLMFYEPVDFLTYCKVNNDVVAQWTDSGKPWSIANYMRVRDSCMEAQGYLSQNTFDGDRTRVLLGRNLYEDIAYTRYGDVTFTIRTIQPRFATYMAITRPPPAYPMVPPVRNDMVSNYAPLPPMVS